MGGNNGREKLQKEARHRRHKERQKAARSSLLDRIRDFLTVDSFMYGPLLTQQPKFPSLPTDSPPAPLSHGMYSLRLLSLPTEKKLFADCKASSNEVYTLLQYFFWIPAQRQFHCSSKDRSESLMNLSRVVVVYGLHMQVEIMDMVRLQVAQQQLQEKQEQQQLMSKTKMSQKLEEPQQYKVGMKRQASSIKDQDRQPPPHSCLCNRLWKSLLQKLPPLQLNCSNWKELHKHTCGN